VTKAVVLSPFYPVSDRLDISHRAGWARYWANEMRHQGDDVQLLTTQRMKELDELRRGDVAYLYHGMEFKGQLNLQSGLSDDILTRAKRIMDAHKRGVRFVSLDQFMPAYGDLLAERGLDPTSAEALNRLKGRSPFLRTPTGTSATSAVIGDSHSLSMYTPGTAILREDGQTLHGALKAGLNAKVASLDFEMGVEVGKLERLSFYYGNIDIRHHIFRQQDTKAAIKELVVAYSKQLLEVQDNFEPGAIEIVMPLPIENECRQIPKSGWYKGAPFAGDWRNRDAIRSELRTQLQRMAKKCGFMVYDHPKHFTNQQGELTFDVMEQPRSVHIRPAEYRLIHEGASWLV
jgi:hypothetical protein